MTITAYFLLGGLAVAIVLVIAGLLLQVSPAPKPATPEEAEQTQQLPARPTGRAQTEKLKLSRHSAEDFGQGTQRLVAYPPQIYRGRPHTTTAHGEEIYWKQEP